MKACLTAIHKPIQTRGTGQVRVYFTEDALIRLEIFIFSEKTTVVFFKCAHSEELPGHAQVHTE